ncbi:MAG: hypothetical protein IPM64_12415 [Phycisphaerales bacterium]|nr:hypothetical protein [Phycisphaerales bacterium]
MIVPTRPYTPRHKGKVERGVDYVQENALKGRTFDSLADQNRYLAEWEAAVADTRIHGTTRQQVGRVFEQIERPALRPLPATRFPCFQEGQRIVNRDGHVEVAKAYYSAPPEFLGRKVWIRWDSQVVRLFDPQFKQIAIHARRGCRPLRHRSAAHRAPRSAAASSAARSGGCGRRRPSAPRPAAGPRRCWRAGFTPCAPSWGWSA